MKLQQLRAFCVVVDQHMSISGAARVLCTTQPAVSKQIRQLEDSLGAALLIRSKSRILGLTDVGAGVLKSARAMMAATEDIGHIVDEHLREANGRLSLATTHTHARYALHDIIPDFARRHPGVGLHIVQATPGEIADLVVTGQVDLGISTISQVVPPALVTIPCYVLDHVIVGTLDHPIFEPPQITLEMIARHPMITYSDEHAVGRRLNEAFEAAGLTPRVAVRGTDVEIMKYYAASGLGLAVIPRIAYAKARDRRLAARPVDHLLSTSTVYLLVRRGAYWPRHLYEFVGSLAPELTRDRIEDALLSAPPPA
jgi:DNA-binding transcriptional LysR family regulator